MGANTGSSIERAKAEIDRSRRIAGMIGETELAIAVTLEDRAVTDPARASALRDKAARLRAFAEIERRVAGRR